MTSYLLVVNPKSGSGRALACGETLGSYLVLSHAEVDVVTTERRGFASDVVSERGADFERVIAIGGDGTLNEVLGGLMRIDAGGRRPALGYVPAGTANAAAPAFGLSSPPERVAAALPDAEARPVDVGMVRHDGTERPFLLWFGAGYDAVVIDALNSRRTGHMGLGGLARGMPGVVRAVHRYDAPDVSVMAEGRPHETAASVIVTNVAAMGFGATAVDTADPFDGRMDLLTVPRTGTLGLGALWLRMMTSSLHSARGVRHGLVTRVRLESEGEVPFQLDGEPAGTLPVEIRVEPGAVRLLLT